MTKVVEAERRDARQLDRGLESTPERGAVEAAANLADDTSSPAETAKRFLRLGPRPFRAEPGRPTFASFRLSKANLRMLEAARRIRMRGSVLARDALGNTTRRTFHFTLRAPKAARRYGG